MKIIYISNKAKKVRSFYINYIQLFTLGLFFLIIVLSLAALLNYFSLVHAVRNESFFIQSILENIHRSETKNIKDYARESLGALTKRVGQMQAKLYQLDNMGKQLITLSGINPKDFTLADKSKSEQIIDYYDNKKFSLSELNKLTKKLNESLEDRSNKLEFLKTTLTNANIKKQLNPNRIPIHKGWYSSNFGWRIDPFTKKRAFHEGVDFIAPPGSYILAAGGGVVVFSSFHPQYGNMIEIDHGNGLVTRYAHALKLKAKVGQVVVRGQKIAIVGSTGRSTGLHLHFEVRRYGKPQDPMKYLKGKS